MPESDEFGAGWSAATTRPWFSAEGLGLDGMGAAGPENRRKNSA